MNTSIIDTFFVGEKTFNYPTNLRKLYPSSITGTAMLTLWLSSFITALGIVGYVVITNGENLNNVLQNSAIIIPVVAICATIATIFYTKHSNRIVHETGVLLQEFSKRTYNITLTHQEALKLLGATSYVSTNDNAGNRVTVMLSMKTDGTDGRLVNPATLEEIQRVNNTQLEAFNIKPELTDDTPTLLSAVRELRAENLEALGKEDEAEKIRAAIAFDEALPKRRTLREETKPSP